MGIERSIRTAFCEGFRVREVPIGFAITTPFSWLGADPLTLYARVEGDRIRFEDSGATLALLEDTSGDLSSEARVDALYMLAAEHGVVFDEDGNRFFTQWVDSSASERELVLFVSFMNRIQDMQLLNRDRVENTFREDLIEYIKEKLMGKYEIVERGEIAHPRFKGYVADLIVSGHGRSAAIYAATAEVKALEALLAAELIHREKLQNVRPYLVYENYVSSHITTRTRTRTMNSEVLQLADWSGGPDEIVEKVESAVRAA